MVRQLKKCMKKKKNAQRIRITSALLQKAKKKRKNENRVKVYFQLFITKYCKTCKSCAERFSKNLRCITV